MEVARTSMIHADAPQFLWAFVVRYAAHQLNIWPRVSVSKTSPTLRWTGEVGDASAFRGLAPSGVNSGDAGPGGADFGGASFGGAISGGAGSGGTERTRVGGVVGAPTGGCGGR
ncbi:unnamed protein product [Closterium sp. NIES-54]